MFDPVLREGYHRLQTVEPDLVAAREAFLAYEHLVLVLPLWCGDMPGIMKGFIERIMQPNLVALDAAGDNGDWKIYEGKPARLIMTMGVPGWFRCWYFGAQALKLIKRNILHFTGICPVRAAIHGMVEAVSVGRRKQWLRDREALGPAAR